MFRFSIRELMLVTMIVALAVGCWINRRQLRDDLNDALDKADAATLEADKLLPWKYSAAGLAEIARREGWEVTFDEHGNYAATDSPNSSAPAPNP